MSELKPVEYKIISINEVKARARIKFINPYKKDDGDNINIDHERDVSIPMIDGEADVDLFKSILEQLASAQSNKMLITLKKSTETKEDAFKGILDLDKNITIETPDDTLELTSVDEVDPAEELKSEPEEVKEEASKPKPVTKLKPSKTTPPKKTASKAKTTSK